uniref:biotin/lipoyl-binding protein n=1 Tax=Pelomonas sp. KK5 TaxID=1855730 RepID=UPI00117DEFFA
MKTKNRSSNSLAALAARLAPLALTLAVAALAALAGREVFARYADDPWTRDAHLRADVLQVSPDVSGLVTAVNVHDNQAVKAGELLFRIDPARYELALAQARAAHAQSRAALAQSAAGLDNQRALLA